MRDQRGEKNPFYGKRHTAETRRKMSAAHSGRSRVGRGNGCSNLEEGYRLLIAAVIRSALKDNEASFFYTDTGKYFCDYIGVVPDKLLEKYNMHIAQHSGSLP